MSILKDWQKHDGLSASNQRSNSYDTDAKSAEVSYAIDSSGDVYLRTSVSVSGGYRSVFVVQEPQFLAEISALATHTVLAQMRRQLKAISERLSDE